MSCDEAIMDQEQLFIDPPNSVTRLEMSGDELRLLDDGGAVLARFS